MEFICRIADINIKVCCRYDYSYKVFYDYIVESKNYDFSVCANDEDIKYEKDNFTDIPDFYAENLSLFRKISTELTLSYNGLLFHCSSISYKDCAFLFTAPSGTGKSTHAKHLINYLDGNAKYINDDKPFIRYFEDEDCFYVYGTPWCGKHRLGNNIKVKLKAICILKRGETNSITKIDFTEAMPYVFGQILKAENKEYLDKQVELLSKLNYNVNYYKLFCINDISSAKVSVDNMINVEIGEKL